MLLKYALLIFASFSISSSRIFDNRDFRTIECSIVAILTDRIEESKTCNLKHLLQKELQATEKQFEPIRSYKKRTAFLRKFPPTISTCGADDPCRVSGQRTCLCPSTYVCEPSIPNFHKCVKLGYYALMGL